MGRSLDQRSPTDCGVFVCTCMCVYVGASECDHVQQQPSTTSMGGRRCQKKEQRQVLKFLYSVIRTDCMARVMDFSECI